MEEVVWHVRSKKGFTPNQRRKLAQFMAIAGSGGDEFPGDDLLDSQGRNLLDSQGRELTDNQRP